MQTSYVTGARDSAMKEPFVRNIINAATYKMISEFFYENVNSVIYGA